MTAGTLSASGARISGDDYQHLFAWCLMLQALQTGSEIAALGVEDPAAGNVDDVTLYPRQGRDRYYQVKFSVDARQLVNVQWLTSPSRAGGQSILQRFHQTWKDQQRSTRPELTLVTNRPLDPDDPVLTMRDGKDGTVDKPLARATPSSALGKARQQLAQHLNIDETELLAFLGDLRFRIGKLHNEWKDHAALLMCVLGLRQDEASIQAGIGLVRGWVTSGKRQLTVDEVRAQVAALHLDTEQPAASLLVQALDYDLMPESATLTLDWVALHEGQEPRTRRRLHDPRIYNERLRPELLEAARQLRAGGHSRIFVRGTMRLPTWFTVGTTFAKTASFNVMALQGGQLWASKGEVVDFPLATILEKELGSGDELTLVVSLATDISQDVQAYLSTGVPDAGRYVCLAPPTGSNNGAIRTAAEARGCAFKIRDLARQYARTCGSNKFHLFLAMPGGLALLLGHLWDRMPATQLYEDLGGSSGYLPSFLIPN